MPGFVVTFANTVTCSHGGAATPAPPAGRVQIMGVGVVTLAHTYKVTGCGLPAASSGTQPPCVSGRYTAGALRVKSMGMAVAIIPSPSQCTPNPTPLLQIPGAQGRVTAT
jgi:hypothetical protein